MAPQRLSSSGQISGLSRASACTRSSTTAQPTTSSCTGAGPGGGQFGWGSEVEGGLEEHLLIPQAAAPEVKLQGYKGNQAEKAKGMWQQW